MLESFKSDAFTYQKLTPEEMEQRGILGRLVGVIADYKNPTRNGRLYSAELWEKVFSDPIVQEKIKNRVMLGELQHPADRLETDPEKAAIIMAEVPKKGEDGRLYGVFDIVNTPNGRILKTLCDYGCKIGISSRGNGETTTDYDGNESVVPESYQFECFDTVLVPGVEAARLTYVTEGLNNKKTLKQALNESLEKASEDDKKVMKETLDNLHIGYSDSEKESDNIQNSFAAKDTGAEVLKTLQESLLAKEKADATITELQEKLSVCYAKEASMEEDLNKYKVAIRNLSEKASNVKTLQSKLDELTEELNTKADLIQKKDKQLREFLIREKETVNKSKSLNKNLSTKETQLSSATERVALLTEKLHRVNKKFEEEQKKLTESYETLKKDYTIKQTEYTTKLTNANNLIEQYRQTAKRAVDKYIESKSVILGIKSEEVKNKLPKNYSFNDIDALCEELSNYSLQINSLPFDVKAVKKVSITESRKIPTDPISQEKEVDDDYIDESLLNVAKKLVD